MVGECNDGFLNDMHGRRIGEAELRQALASASTGAVAEGAVGGGTGLSCFEWKGGIGSASRRVPDQHGGFTLGVLVQSNFGAAAELVVSGVPVGRHIRPPDARPTNTGETSDQGSIVMVIATDAPLDGRQLERISRRAGFGLARTGSTCHSGSGDVVIAFSTGYRIPDRPSTPILMRDTLANEQAAVTTLGQAVVEAIEEAVLNSLFMSETMVGRDGNTRHGLPVAEVVDLVGNARP